MKTGWKSTLRWVEPWHWAVAFSFFLVYFRSLAFRYVEGDDAATVAFHALGRRPDVQPPYGRYHAGMDFWLQLLPPREELLRVVAIGTSALAMLFLTLQVLALIFAMANEGAVGKVDRRSSRVWFGLVILLAVPELFFLGVVFTPTVVGLLACVVAHRLLRPIWRPGGRTNKDRPLSWPKLIFAGILFGFGVSCRFDVALYGVVVLLDALLLGEGKSGGRTVSEVLVERFRRAVAKAWIPAALSLVTFGVVLAFVGYGGSDLRKVAELSSTVANVDESFRAFVFRFSGAHQAFYTPALLLMTLVGLCTVDRWLRMFIVAQLLAIGLIVVLLRWPIPKMYLVFLPGLMLSAHAAWTKLFANGSKAEFRWRLGVSAVALLPWLVGVRMDTDDTAWGPGFERSLRDRAAVTDQQTSTRDAAPARLVSSKNRVYAALGSGLAFPTPEGPRPLWGFGWVLLGGEQRTMTLSRDDERRAAIDLALEQKLPIVILQGAPGFVLSELTRRGLSTNDGRVVGDGVFEEGRRFGPRAKDSGAGCEPCDSGVLFKVNERLEALAQSPETVERAIAQAGSGRVLVLGYSSSLRRLDGSAPGATKLLGPESGILDLTSLLPAEAGNVRH